MPWFRTQTDLVNEMLSDLFDITGLQLSASDNGREEVIKIKQWAIMFSHAYAQIDRVADDFFPASATLQGLLNHLVERQMEGRILAQPSTGTIQLTGVNGSPIVQGTRVQRIADGNVFYSLADAVIDDTGQVQIGFKSVLSGQAQNEDALADEYQLVSAITGIDNACTNVTEFSGGRDDETAEEILVRIEAHDRNPNTGGNLIAYEAFAFAASPLVVSAQSIKNPRGQDTVDTIITSGTTDIAAAVNAGIPVVRIPDDSLVDLVQAYIVANNPTTDDHQTIVPVEDAFNTTVTYDLYDETLRSVVDAKITKIWKIYVYSAPSNQKVDPTALERAIDTEIAYLIWKRRVSNFGGAHPSYLVPAGHLLTPGVLTLQDFGDGD